MCAATTPAVPENPQEGKLKDSDSARLSAVDSDSGDSTVARPASIDGPPGTEVCHKKSASASLLGVWKDDYGQIEISDLGHSLHFQQDTLHGQLVTDEGGWLVAELLD